MSLILRKECQDVLDNFSLNNYHVAISDNKSLRVVGECGKPLFSVRGIVFSRNTPSAKEIEYAVELLEDFLGTHILIINEMMEAQEKLADHPVPDDQDGMFSAAKGESVKISREGIEITIKLDTKDESVTLRVAGGYGNLSRSSMKELKQELTNIQKLYKPAREYLQQTLEHSQASSELYSLQAKLNTCDI